MCYFAADAKDEGADEESQVQDASPGCVEDEVEGECQGEETDEVQGFVGLRWDVGFGGFGRGGEGAMGKETEGGGEEED